MKYLKTYENLKPPKIKIGDYVVSKFNWAGLGREDEIRWQNYINKHIGEVIDIRFNDARYTLRVKYYLPEDIASFKDTHVGNEFEKKDGKYVIMHFHHINDILYYSPNKKELEVKLKTKQYGLRFNENKIEEPKEGDYVISNFSYNNKKWQDYINSHIGQIDKIQDKHGVISNIFYTKYYVPISTINDIFPVSTHSWERETFKEDSGGKYIMMTFESKDILYYSPNKRDMERKLKTKKYGLGFLTEGVVKYPDNVEDVTDDFIIYVISSFNQLIGGQSETLYLGGLLELYDDNKIKKVHIMDYFKENEDYENRTTFDEKNTRPVYSRGYPMDIIYRTSSVLDAKNKFENLKEIYLKTKWGLRKSTKKYNMK